MLEPDELRHLPRRDALCAERRALRASGTRRCGWSRPMAIGWPCRCGRLGRGRRERSPASCRARRSRRSCASWARAKRSRSRSRENQFVLQMPNFVMTARLIEGQFPNYEAVIPKGHPGELVIGSRRALGGPSPGLGHGRGAQQAGQADPGPGVSHGSAHRARISARPRRRWTSSTRARRSRSASIPAICSTPWRRSKRSRSCSNSRTALSPGVVKSVEERGILLCYNAHANLAMIFALKMGVLEGADRLRSASRISQLSGPLVSPRSTDKPPYRT